MRSAELRNHACKKAYQMSMLERVLIAIALGVLLFLYVQQNQQIKRTFANDSSKINDIHERISMLDDRISSREMDENDEEIQGDGTKQDAAPPPPAEDIPDAFDTLGLAPVGA